MKIQNIKLWISGIVVFLLPLIIIGSKPALESVSMVIFGSSYETGITPLFIPLDLGEGSLSFILPTIFLLGSFMIFLFFLLKDVFTKKSFFIKWFIANLFYSGYISIFNFKEASSCFESTCLAIMGAITIAFPILVFVATFIEAVILFRRKKGIVVSAQ